jgi:hypothetical protein
MDTKAWNPELQQKKKKLKPATGKQATDRPGLAACQRPQNVKNCNSGALLANERCFVLPFLH